MIIYDFTEDTAQNLIKRLMQANVTLLGMAEEDSWGAVRLAGKAEGVRLALSYVEEAMRFSQDHTEAQEGHQ